MGGDNHSCVWPPPLLRQGSKIANQVLDVPLGQFHFPSAHRGIRMPVRDCLRKFRIVLSLNRRSGKVCWRGIQSTVAISFALMPMADLAVLLVDDSPCSHIGSIRRRYPQYLKRYAKRKVRQKQQNMDWRCVFLLVQIAPTLRLFRGHGPIPKSGPRGSSGDECVVQATESKKEMVPKPNCIIVSG